MYSKLMEDISMANEYCYGGFDLGYPMVMTQEQNPPPSCFSQQPQQSYSQSSTFQLQTSDARVTPAESERAPKGPTTAESVGERGRRPVASEDDARSLNAAGGAVDGPHGGRARENASSQWQRMKWSDQTGRLLIVVVSYLGEVSSADSYCNIGRKRKLALVQKQGKWKLVSKVMAERGCYVSPQQCEDKLLLF